jgi:hypothetical protein
MSLPVKPVSRDKARRDTFISLKKTCRKLGVSFWDYLNDRIAQAECIPSLSAIFQARAAPA